MKFTKNMYVAMILLIIISTSIIALYWIKTRENFLNATDFVYGRAVVFYNQCYNTGTPVYRGEGVYNSLKAWDVASIKLPSGWKVTINVPNNLATFKNDTSTLVITENLSCFGDVIKNVSGGLSWVDIDNITVTVEKLPIIDNRPSFYKNENYNGEALKLGVGAHNAQALGTFSAAISSFQIPKGIKITLYDKSSFSGKSIVFTESVPQLSKIPFDNIPRLSWDKRVKSVVISTTQ